MRKLALVVLSQTLLMLAGCGGGSGTGVPMSNNGTGTGPADNTVTITVDGGPDPSTVYDVDMPFVTVTVCAPGSTTNCQQIDHVEVDTGSYGLRLVSSVLNSSVAAGLQQEQTNNTPIVECTEFVDGISWGPVELADVQVGGESAHAVPIQVMGDTSFESEVPAACSSNGPEEDTVASFGANGVLGLGPFGPDCGSGCVLSNSNYAANPTYYACPAGGTSTSDCKAIGPTVEQQVTNPVVAFQTDNNGVLVQMPSVPDPDGSTTVTGSLIFGIGTESNNGLGGATVLTANGNGEITTTYAGQSLPDSYLDTGSNAYYFDDSSIPQCPSSGGSASTWFCPTSELTLSATNAGANGTDSTVSFHIANADTLFNDYPNNTALDDLGADSGSQSSWCKGPSDCYFDFGLPFFFGRTVFVAIAGTNTSGGPGPYYAY